MNSPSGAKVSPDGSTWYESLIISRSSGVAGLGVNGSAGAPALTWSGDPDNGLYRTGANAWSLACAGAQAIGIAASAISIPYSTASTSTATGALTVAGGLGVAGALYVGGAIGGVQAISLTANAALATGPSISNYNGTNTLLLMSAGQSGIQFNNQAQDTVLAAIANGGGMTIGSPTSGNKGAGTLNATAVYDDNVLLTDYVFDKFLGLANKTKSYSPRVREKHDTLDVSMFDVGVFAAYWREHQRLYGMPDLNDCVDGAVKEHSIGGMTQRLWQVAELQAIHIGTIHDRIREHECRLAALESLANPLANEASRQ